MGKFVSRSNPVKSTALKRRPAGTVAIRHYGREDVRFTRTHGGWRHGATGEVVSSSAVAAEVNAAVGCKESWAMVY